jgi:hypothetical protein
MNEPKGTISKSDIELLLAFGSRMEALCERLGYDYLSRQAQTVQRIAISGLTRRTEARRAAFSFPMTARSILIPSIARSRNRYRVYRRDER